MLLCTMFLVAVSFVFMKAHTVNAAETDTLFKEIYYTYRESSSATPDVYRIKLIDADTHTYVVSDYRFRGSTTVRHVSSDAYQYHFRSNPQGSIQGVLASDTAKVVSLASLSDPNMKVTYTDDEISSLPDDLDIQDFYTWFDSGQVDKAITKTKEEAGNIFSANYKGSSYNVAGSQVQVFRLTVRDGGEETVCTILREVANTDYEYFDSIEKWNRVEINGGPDWSEHKDTIKLYDGTDQKEELLDEKYQYGKTVSWQSGNYASGLTEEYDSLLEKSQITLPAEVKSVRVSLENDLPESGQAACLEMPGNVNTLSETVEQNTRMHDYYYYRNKTHAVSINGGAWHDIKQGQPSPELKLRKGLNIIYVVGTDKATMESGKTPGTYAMGLLNYVLLVYWEGEEGYKVAEGSDTSLKDLELYQGASDTADAEARFGEIEVKETKDADSGEVKKTIDMNSSYPYIYINAITKDAAAKVEVEETTNLYGSLFKRLDPKKDFFDIKVTSADGKKEITERIYVNWTYSSAELESLSVVSGGSMEKKYDPETTSYYCKRSGSGKVMLSYSTPQNTTTDVYVDRQKKTSIDGEASKVLSLDADVKEVQWTITTASGKKVRYKMYFNRDKGSSISEETKARAKKMIDKMVAGGYETYLKEQKGGDYWKTFGAAALGEEYLDGMLGYDVTQHNFRQATDWAAVILELVMSGENPYDYLGTNYVEGLMKFNDDGDFGQYSANIWALSALQAAGAEIPEKTIATVKKQSISFELDMRGWAMYAITPYLDTFTDKEYAQCIDTLKDVEIQDSISVKEYNVTGCFENSYYTNRNINSHACVVTGLTAWGIDVGSGEFDGENGKNPLNILEDYQTSSGGFFYTPDSPNEGGWNKDAVIAVGDLYNGSNVYTRYYLTQDRYKELVDEAKALLSADISDESKRESLQAACDEAEKYLSEGTKLSTHGDAYYALQEAMYAVDKSVKPGVFLGTAEERESVKAVIEAIDSISSYSYSDKEKLDSIKESYDALKEDRLYHYVTNADTLNKVYAYVEGIDTFLARTDKIGKVNLTKTAKIKKAREAYEALSEKQKEEKQAKEAYEILKAAEAKLAQAKTADYVVKAIDGLGSIATLDGADDIESVRAAYENLTEEQKTFVTNLAKLEELEKALVALEAQQDALKAAQEVSNLIDAIGTVNNSSKDALEEARAAYDAIESDEARRMVTNYGTLEDDGKIYENLLSENALAEAVDNASYKIAQAYEHETIDASNASEIEEKVREAEAYIEEQEAAYADFAWMLPDYQDLMQVKEELAAYEISGKTEATAEEFKSAVDAIGEVTLDSGPAVTRAQSLYDLLSEEDKNLVAAEKETLDAARTAVDGLDSEFSAICDVVYAAARLGEVTWEDADAYLAVKESLNLLSEEAQALLPEATRERLAEAGETYEAIAARQEKIGAVVAKIEEASLVTSLDEADVVTAARAAYEVLNEESACRVTNYIALVKAENTVLSLKKEKEDKEIAAKVRDQIAGLKDAKSSDKEKVEAARRAYDGLTDKQKEIVDNLSVLEKAEDVVASPENTSKEKGETTTSAKGATRKSSKTKSTAKKSTTKKISLKKKTTRKTLYLKVAKKYTLVLYVKGKKVSGSKVKWKSSKKSVASVSKKGVVTLKKKGKATITASYRGKKYRCELTVKKACFKLKKSKGSIRRGKSVMIKSTALPRGKVTYKSLNPKVAKVSKKGKVTGVRRGTTKIKARCNGITRYFKITVK